MKALWEVWRAILGKKAETPFIFCPCESGVEFAECHGKTEVDPADE